MFNTFFRVSDLPTSVPKRFNATFCLSFPPRRRRALFPVFFFGQNFFLWSISFSFLRTSAVCRFVLFFWRVIRLPPKNSSSGFHSRPMWVLFTYWTAAWRESAQRQQLPVADQYIADQSYRHRTDLGLCSKSFSRNCHTYVNRVNIFQGPAITTALVKEKELSEDYRMLKAEFYDTENKRTRHTYASGRHVETRTTSIRKRRVGQRCGQQKDHWRNTGIRYIWLRGQCVRYVFGIIVFLCMCSYKMRVESQPSLGHFFFEGANCKTGMVFDT